eukprot:11161175-Lingulodinium_polyedra.AAC.1
MPPTRRSTRGARIAGGRVGGAQLGRLDGLRLVPSGVFDPVGSGIRNGPLCLPANTCSGP